MDVLWKTARVSEDEAVALAHQEKIPLRVARWLCARGISADTVHAYLAPSELPPFAARQFADMDRAVARLVYAITQKQRIVIVGDYDVDGVTASAIVATALQRLDADYLCEIPHRISDGYGLQPHIVERIAAEQHPDLLLTVDNGIRSNEAVELAVELGMDVIVTDHHEPGDELPAADVVVHWAKSADPAETMLLSGAGVAYQLASVLLDAFGVSQADPVRAAQVGLAALGALADVMPMKGENRRLVSIGIKALERWQAPGWRALRRSAGCLDKPLTDRVLLWQIAPRINAAGRMDTAQTAFELLMCDSEIAAAALAQQLEDLNGLRRAETDQAFAQAVLQLPARETSPVAVVAAGPWHLGVAGIVAARLADAYGCPAIVLCDSGNDILKGSGRAPEGISLHQALTEIASVLHHYGGHAAAAGCGVARSQVEAFRVLLSEAVARQAESMTTGVQSQWLADDFLPLAEVNRDLMHWLDCLAPYGPTFPVFQFYAGPVQVTKLDWLKGGKHLRLTLTEERHQVEAIWFSPPEHAAQLKVGDWLSAIVEVTRNVWRGTERISLTISKATKLENVRNRQDFAAVYRLLKAIRQVAAPDVVAKVPMTDEASAKMMLDAFVELGFATRTASAYHVVEYATPRDLRESRSYQRHLTDTLLQARAER